jgi:hypothetical protein
VETRIQKGGITLVIERSGNQVNIRTTYREGKLPAGIAPNPHAIEVSTEEFVKMLDQLDLGDGPRAP